MFAKYKIGIGAIKRLLGDSKNHGLLLESQNYINNRTSQLLEKSDDIIDGAALKDGYFPTSFKKKYRIFISHSHRDVETIERFADYLKFHHHVDCFVDSMVWKNIDTLQHKIDQKFSKSTTGGLDYKKILQTTAHVHSLLSIALFEMIDQCECCIFVESGNSLQIDFAQPQTLSPWIYEELYYMNHTEERIPQHILDARYKVLQTKMMANEALNFMMLHPVDLTGFTQLNNDWLCTSHKGDDFMKLIYLLSCKISK